MDYFQAQEALGSVIRQPSKNVRRHCWRLKGDQPNSLSRFLSIKEDDLKLLLRLCGVYQGSNDSISKNNLDLLIQRSGVDSTMHKKERCILVGEDGDLAAPKGQCDSKGQLKHPPWQDIHIESLSRKQKGDIPSLLNQSLTTDAPTPKKPPSPDGKNANDLSPMNPLANCIKSLVKKDTVTDRDMRALNRMLNSAVESMAKGMLSLALERLAKEQMMLENAEVDLLTPEPAPSNPTAEQVPAEEAVNLATPAVLEMDVEAKGEETVQDEFLRELQEEALLQSLLHKKTTEKKQRVLELEHKNGRRFLAVCPPESKTASSHEADARKHRWIDRMADTVEKRRGLLAHMAKRWPNACNNVHRMRKMVNNPFVTTTCQAMALARVGNWNDVRCKKARSFLKNMCGAQLSWVTGILSRAPSSSPHGPWSIAESSHLMDGSIFAANVHKNFA